VVRHGGELQGFFVRRPSGQLGRAKADKSEPGRFDLTEKECRTVAPNLVDQMYLLRPTPGFSQPALCTLHELRTVYTIDDLADFHEILDFRAAASEKMEKVVKRERDAAAARSPRKRR